MLTRQILRVTLLSLLGGLFALTAGAASCSVSTGGGDDDGSATPDTVIQSVTMTKTVTGNSNDPGPATTVFGTKDTVYAVVAIKNAPKETKFTARYTVVDVGTVANPGQEIDSVDVVAGGTQRLKFNLTAPTAGFPNGKYQLEISVDGQVKKTVAFSVR